MSKTSRSFSNLSIKAKVVMLSSILIIFTLIVGVFGFISLGNVNSEYELLFSTAAERKDISEELLSESTSFKAMFYNVIVQSKLYGNGSSTEKAINDILTQNDKITEIMERYNNAINSDPALTEQAKQNLHNLRNNFINDFSFTKDIVNRLYEACKNNDDNVIEECFSEMDSVWDKTKTNVAAIRKAAVDREDVLKESATSTVSLTNILIVSVSLLGIIIAIILSVVVIKSITKPINILTDASIKAANGDFSGIHRTNSTNEVGLLSNNLAMLIDTMNNIIEDMDGAFKAMNAGDTDKRINTVNYQGEYKKISENINHMLDSTVNELKIITDGINQYAEGNFDYTSPRFAGKKVLIHESLDAMKNHVIKLSGSIEEIISNINSGNLDIHIDSGDLKGSWALLLNNLNLLVENVSNPIKSTKDALSELSNGNFSFHIDSSQFNGEFKEMIDNINSTVSILSDYIAEISDILKEMANQNLNVAINHEYIGDFKTIQDSLELIISNFNQLIKEIIMSSEQVAIGSQSIADSSTTLAQGASEQASAVEELTATIGLVSKNAERNTENIFKSNELANNAKESATRIRDEMQDLLKAMDAINESSNNISNIIKVIDDIAFQTNILALNAAVEAARAGEHGKGFAVVADEVRSLAARSQTSAQETSTLIAESLDKANQGSEIVNRTADTVRKIVNQIDEISALSVEVANDSKEQTNSISEINIGINQIATVVSNNTATSEESAAASEELASQSAVFKTTVSKFNLK